MKSLKMKPYEESTLEWSRSGMNKPYMNDLLDTIENSHGGTRQILKLEVTPLNKILDVLEDVTLFLE